MHNSFNRGAVKIAGLTLTAALAATLAGCNGTSSTGTGTASAGGSDTIATVGSTKVTHADLASFLEAQQGEQVLPYLIDTQIIFEAAKAKGLDVTDAEVDADLARRQEADPSVAEILKNGGPKLAVAKNQVKRELAIQKLLTADIKATDAQVKSFFAKYAKYYDQPAKAKVGLLFSSTKARAELMGDQLKKGTKTFDALVAEQKMANDPVAKQSAADRGQFETLENFSPAIAAQITKLPKGGTTPPQQINVGLPTPVFIIFRKTDFQPAKKADLATMRPQVEMDYKLAEAARKTVSQNPQNPPFDETLRRTQQYMQSQNPSGGSPKLRDVLNYINQTAINTMVAKMRTSGTVQVQVDDPTYATVAQQYQAMPTLGTAPGAAGNTASAPAAGNTAPAPK